MILAISGAVITILLLILYGVVREIKKLEAHINSLNLIIDSACKIDPKPSNQQSKGLVQINKRRSTRAYRRGSYYICDEPYRGSSSSDSSYESSSSRSSSSGNDTDYSGGGGGFSGGGSSGSWD